nr:NO-associated protein 1, chloroplastic/mitochondrial [Tanacetum cinerariifolium]
MNPKTLSLTSSFTPIHHPKPISKKLHHTSVRVKPICTSQPDIHISQGTGPAAPTRGDIFFEKQQQIQSLVVEKKKKLNPPQIHHLRFFTSATTTSYAFTSVTDTKMYHHSTMTLSRQKRAPAQVPVESRSGWSIKHSGVVILSSLLRMMGPFFP